MHRISEWVSDQDDLAIGSEVDSPVIGYGYTFVGNNF